MASWIDLRMSGERPSGDDGARARVSRPDLPDDDPIGPRLVTDPDAEAHEWLARMDAGDVGEVDRATFARWHADPENAAAYAEAEHLWEMMLHSAAPPDNVVTLKRYPERLADWHSQWGRRVAAIAASVAVLALTGYEYATVWQFDHATQGSARGHAALDDGSSVELNTGSAIDVAYEAGQRRVRLARGEAFFDVKRNPARPFVVAAGAGEVRVLGTAFAVKREGDGARVTVIRGKVRVSSGGRFVDLVPNQQVTFGSGGVGLANGARVVDATSALAWSRGQLVFQNRPLAEVLAAIDRYYPGAIVLTDNAAGRQRINATVNLDRIDEWVTTIARSQRLSARSWPGLLLLD